MACDRARALDWNDLRYLLAIARHGTLAGAARALGVEHTTVGRRLGSLETALEAKLFTRSPDGFALTPAGREIVPLAEAMERSATAIERRVSGEDTRVAGNVRLTTSEALSGYLVTQFSELRERHPELVVEILSGNRAYDLLRGEADLAVRVRETTEPELVARRIATAGWSLYASPSYVERKGAPADPEVLAGHDVVGFDQSLAFVPGALWLEEHAAGASVVLRGNSIVAALNAATFGVGIAVLPCFLADPETRLVRLTARVVGSRDVSLVVHPDLAKVARVRAVMDCVVAAFARDAALWSGAGPASR
ncbi:MAG TPA: LysR family transcriptional regulator [Polyangiaceae bacterium]|nr:LysR family transcriptional regulator [Polyangiaceae bacterium]